ncbi:MAG TPA: M28 family peptidase, partial [Longimicrobiales bacterium]|nr:M28 family peptidase [Longimicrobiales bacterium]
FSTWPGRFGVSVAGAVYLGGALLAARMLYRGFPGFALALLLAVLVVIAGIAMLARTAITALPWGRVEATNLVAHVPGKRPRYYIMAHRDSKSQPVPLAFRGPAIVLAILAWIALIAATSLALLDPIFLSPDLIVVLGVIAVVAGAILVLCWVDNRSPGALDNASGVATLLGIAEREAANGDVAVIVTDAEELGLAGARAIAPLLPACFGVINLDGIDDDGHFYIIERFGWPTKKGAAPHLAAALLGAAAALNHEARRRDVPIGLLLDHIPIVNAGTPALTVMRGSLRSLQRVHRPADSLSHLLGTGVTQGVGLICAALQRMRESP